MKGRAAMFAVLAFVSFASSTTAAELEGISFGTTGNIKKELTTSQYRGWSFTLAGGVVGIDVTYLGLYCGGAHADRLAYLCEQVGGVWVERASVTVPAETGSGMQYVELGASCAITNANTWAVMGYYPVGEYYRDTFSAVVDSNLNLGDWYRDRDLSGTWTTTSRNLGGIFRFEVLTGGGGVAPEPGWLGLVGVAVLAVRRRSRQALRRRRS